VEEKADGTTIKRTDGNADVETVQKNGTTDIKYANGDTLHKGTNGTTIQTKTGEYGEKTTTTTDSNGQVVGRTTDWSKTESNSYLKARDMQENYNDYEHKPEQLGKDVADFQSMTSEQQQKILSTLEESGNQDAHDFYSALAQNKGNSAGGTSKDYREVENKLYSALDDKNTDPKQFAQTVLDFENLPSSQQQDNFTSGRRVEDFVESFLKNRSTQQ
jgi:hypothetical protein